MTRMSILMLVVAVACDDTTTFQNDPGRDVGNDVTLGTTDASVDSANSDFAHDGVVFADSFRWDSSVDGSAQDSGADSVGDSVPTDGLADKQVDGAADALPDLPPDAQPLDQLPADSTNTTGLTVPCSNGAGWTLFRFHYSTNSTSAAVDVWDASCSYSFAPNSACNVREVYPGFGDVSRTSDGYPILTTSEYLRVRFSVAGLSFSGAAVHLQARSYATASSTYYRVWSPLYGEVENGPVDNDWVYDWYAVDWTGFLGPGDAPSMTAIQIYATKGSAKLAVKAVELCVW